MSEIQNRLQAEKERGQHAKELLEHPILVEALEFMERETVERLKRLDISDEKMRDSLWRELMAAQRFKERLQTVVQRGTAAENKLRQLLRKVI